MPTNYRYDPYTDAVEPVAITGETHIIQLNSPYTIRLKEVPLKESPSTVTLTIDGISASEVAANPAAGEFWCDYNTSANDSDNWNTGLIRFNEADAGKTVIVSYMGIGSLVDADRHGSQMFTSNGIFTVPKGVDKVYISGCGGGGLGGSSSAANESSGGGGGGGGAVFKEAVNVKPGEAITVTVGAPGVAGAGGASSFGAYLTLPGGGAANIGIAGTAGGSGGSAGQGGIARIYQYSHPNGGNGGGGLFGAGGGGGATNAVGSAGSGYGAGGGGGGISTTNRAGGTGTQGMILVEW